MAGTVMVKPRHSYGPETSVKLGFVPLSDCAPLAVAFEMGLFEQHGLKVELSREIGWASIRDKIYYGDLDAAQSISGIAIALGMGFTELRCDVAVPLILNLHGNAITLTNDLKRSDIGKGEGLDAYLKKHWKKDRPFTLAATHRYSSHHVLLRSWLRRHLPGEQNVEIIFIPPPLMPRHLKAGHIDGYCVGEPWNSVSILNGSGWCPVTSSELSHGHPEKVLLLSGRFLQQRRDTAIRLVAALIEACRLCQESNFKNDLISILAMDRYTGASPEVLENSFSGNFFAGQNDTIRSPFHVFHGKSVNRPTIEKASWILSGLRMIDALPEITAGSISRIYREDIYHEAQQISHSG